MKIVIPEEENIGINYLVLIAGIGTFLFTLLYVYSYQSIPNVEINPFFLLSITIIPLVMAGYFTKIYVQSRSIHVIAPGGYYWSTTMLNVKTVTLSIVTRDRKSVTVRWVIIPLGGGVIPNWIPYMGGGRNGFLVANALGVIDLGGNVFVEEYVVKLTAEDLDPMLRKEIYSHKLFKGKPDKIPIYFCPLPYDVKDSDLERPRINNEDTRATTVGEVVLSYVSEVREEVHDYKSKISLKATERALQDTHAKQFARKSNREDENNNSERQRT